MRPETASCLADALLAADRILVKLRSTDQLSYSQSWEEQSILERQFIILGEALIKIRDFEPSVFDVLPDSGRVIGFRNFLVHAYNKVLPERVFEIANEDLPVLRETVSRLVHEAKRQGL